MMNSVIRSLPQKIPFLFALPEQNAFNRQIYLSIVILVFGFVAYIFSPFFGDAVYFGLMAVLLFSHILLAVKTSRLNFLFLFRYSLVWLLIFTTAATWTIWNGDVKTAPFGAVYQDFATTRILVFAGFLSLNGSLIGWLYGCRLTKSTGLPDYQMPRGYRRKLWRVGAAFAFSFALAYFYVKGGLVTSSSAYASGETINVKFAVFNAFQFFGIALIILSATAYERVKKRFIWAAIISLVIGMLAGSRADYMPQALILVMVIYSGLIIGQFREVSTKKMLAFLVLAGVFLVFAYYLGGFIARWRFTGDVSGALDSLFSAGHGGFLSYTYGHPMIWLETGSMALGTLYAAIVNVQSGLTGLLWGSSYFDWLLKAPPAIFGLPRPLGLEWQAKINDQWMSQGGIFEVSEAYWNFGLIGCFMVSFLISFFFGNLLKRGLKYHNFFLLSWYLVFGFMSLRAVWYQNFAYLRIATVMIVIYVAARYLSPRFVRSQYRRDSPL